MLLTTTAGALLAFSPPHALPQPRGLQISPQGAPSCFLGRQAHLDSQRAAIASLDWRRSRPLVAFSDDGDATLGDEEIAAIFREFDANGNGYIDLAELQAALAKAGRPVSIEEAQDILEKVDDNDDGQISLEEFKAALRGGRGALFDVSGFFLNSIGKLGRELGIETSGQWRSTRSGARYVDDVIGDGKLLLTGDVVELHYSVTLLSSNRVVETTRGGLPTAYRLGDADPREDGQGWNDAVAGMRVGGRRRVYASPTEGEGPTARYDIEIIGATEGPEATQEGIIATLGGRRGVLRLLFAASFVPYFLPNDKRPAFFRYGDKSESSDDIFESGAEGSGQPSADSAPAGVSDTYVSKQLDALFAPEK